MVASVEQAFREDWGRVLAALVGILGDIELAEEAAQEAFAVAAERWPREGVPSNSPSWLVSTGRNRAFDRLRRERNLAAKTRLLATREGAEAAAAEAAQEETDMEEATAIPDERLELIFTCCHPALSTESQVALTLRTLGGLTTAEIARAFLVPNRRWPSAWSGPRTRSAPPESPSGCRPTTCCRIASPPCWRSST